MLKKIHDIFSEKTIHRLKQTMFVESSFTISRKTDCASKSGPYGHYSRFVVDQFQDVGQENVFTHRHQIHGNRHAGFDQTVYVSGLVVEQGEPENRNAGVHGLVDTGNTTVAYEQFDFRMHCERTDRIFKYILYRDRYLFICSFPTEHVALRKPFARHHVFRFVEHFALVLPQHPLRHTRKRFSERVLNVFR